jgi:hypothetical protein
MSAVGRAEEVEHLLMKCLFQDGEIVEGKPPVDAILVEGIVQRFGFHQGRVAEIKPRLKEILADMQDPFFKEKSGGWSFLNLPFDRHGQHWGEHRNVEQLVVPT